MRSNDTNIKEYAPKSTQENDGETFECDGCEFSSKWKKAVVRHIKTVHYKIKNYECERCGKSFSQKSNLEAHIASCQKLNNIV